MPGRQVGQPPTAGEHAVAAEGVEQPAAGQRPGAEHLDPPALARGRNRAHRARCVEQRGLGDVVGIGRQGSGRIRLAGVGLLEAEEVLALDIVAKAVKHGLVEPGPVRSRVDGEKQFVILTAA